MVDGFNSSVGKANGIFVNNHYVSTSNHYLKYTTAMTSASSPDVLFTYSYDPVLPWVANGFVEPMDGYAKQLGITRGSLVPVAWDMIYRGGHIWGLPQEFDFDLLYWNKQIHMGAAPKTFAELDALAPRYNKYDAQGNLIQAGLIPWLYGFGDWGPLWGGSFYDQDKGKWTITAPQNRKFLDWMLKYVHTFGGRAKPDALVSSAPTTYRDLFLLGKTAFAMEGEYLPLEIVPLGLAKKLHYGIGLPPTAPGVSPSVTQNGANIFLIPVKSGHPKEAAIFVNYMVSKPALLDWACAIGQNLPTVEAEYSKEFLQCQPWMGPWITYIKENRVINPPLSPAFPVFLDAMGTAVDEVTYLKKTPAQALSDVDNKVSQAVQRFKESHPTWTTE
jgi:ABC-type glycerol-3-phosphate transport system substrate-binding protein